MAVTISGSNFTEATAVNSGSGINVNSFAVGTAAQITANISISSTTHIGVRDVYVTVPAGVATNTSGFTVLDGSPPSTPVVTDDGD